MTLPVSFNKFRVIRARGCVNTYDICLVGLHNCRTKDSLDDLITAAAPPTLFELIPDLVPESRIFSYGCSAGIEAVKSMSIESIRAEAAELLKCLHKIQAEDEEFSWQQQAKGISIDSREFMAREQNRIIFVAYGFGGIVTEEALITAHMKVPYASIAARTSKLIFLRTPQIPRSVQEWTQFLLDGDERLDYRDGEPLSSTIAAMTTYFNGLSTYFLMGASKYYIANIFDNSDVVPASSSPQIKPETSGTENRYCGLKKIRHIHLHCSFHSFLQIPETYSKDLEYFYFELASRELLNNYVSPLFKDNAYLEFLTAITPSRRQIYFPDRFISPRIFSHLELFDAFFRVIPASKSGFIQLVGSAGSGRSTLLRLLETKMRTSQSQPQDQLVAFNAKYVERGPISISWLLRGLIHQILSQTPQLFQRVSNFLGYRWRIGSFSEPILWTVAQLLLQNHEERVVLFIDDFDQSPLYLLFVNELCDRLGPETSLLYIVVSESSSSLQTRLETSVVHLDDENESRVLWLAVLDKELSILIDKHPVYRAFQSEMVAKLSNPGWPLLWRFLYLQQLYNLPGISTRKSISDNFLALPEGPTNIYNHIMEDQIISGLKSWALACLSWTIRSIRPLESFELSVAVALSQTFPDCSQLDEFTSADMVYDLQHHLGTFFNLSDQSIRLIHGSVEAFLFESSYAAEIFSHAKIVEFCLAYITEVVLSVPCPVDYSSGVACLNLSERGRFSFLKYASKYWPVHYLKANPNDSLDRAVISFLQNTECRRRWYEIFWVSQRASDRLSAYSAGTLEIVCLLGLSRVLKILVQEEPGLFSDLENDPRLLDYAVRHHNDEIITILSEKGCKSKFALCFAAESGNYELIPQFVNKGCRLNEKSDCGLAPIHIAASQGCIQALRILINRGADISLKDSSGETVLHHATWSGAFDVVRLLLGESIPVNDLGKRSRPAIAHAAALGFDKVTGLLLQAGADPNISDENKISPLHLGAEYGNLGCVKLLLEAGADISTQSDTGDTAFSFAAANGEIEIISALQNQYDKLGLPNHSDPSTLIHAVLEGSLPCVAYLISHGADVNSNDEYSWRPLHVAAFNGYEDILDYLLDNGADRVATTGGEFKSTALQLAAREGHLGVVKLLLSKPIPNSEGPIFISATIKGFYELVNSFLKFGLDPNEQDERGISPLALACMKGYTAIARRLLQHNADADHQNERKNTPLHFAAHAARTDIVLLLLHAGVDINACNVNDQTALHSVFQYDDAQPENQKISDCSLVGENDIISDSDERLKVVKVLLENKANPMAADEDGCTPLHLASEKGEVQIMELLIKCGCNREATTTKELTPLHYAARNGRTTAVQFLMDMKVDVDPRSRRKSTPLYFAAYEGFTSTINLLVEAGADINALNDEQRTPVFGASLNGKVEAVQQLVGLGADLSIADKDGWNAIIASVKYVEVLNILLPHSHNINVRDNHGDTILMIASVLGASSSVSSLLDAGADVNLEGEDAITALDYAANSHSPDIVRMLIEHGAIINKEDKYGWTALNWAIREHNMETISAMIEQGAEINNTSLPALIHAAYVDDFRVIDFLINKGADLTKELDGTGMVRVLASRETTDSLKSFFQAYKDEVTFDSDDVMQALHWAFEMNKVEVVTLILGSVSNTPQRRCADCGLNALEMALAYEREDLAMLLLEKGADPCGSPCRLGTIPQLAAQAGMDNFLQRVLSKLPNSIQQAHALHELRRAIEGRSVLYWKLFEPSLSGIFNSTDQDQWSINLLLYQANYPFPGTEKKNIQELTSKEKPLAPTRLNFPDLWIANPVDEAAVHFDSTGKEVWHDGEGALTVRADHPLPPRDFDCSYFEVEVIKCPIGEDEKQSCVVIGLCGEFSDLWKAVPGWRKFSAGYHSDLGATYEDVAYEESDHTDLGQTYGEGDVVGCGVDWKSEAYYFTYNGKFLRDIKGKNIFRKLYPAIGLVNPSRVRVNFGERPFKYTRTESSGQLHCIPDEIAPH